MLSLSIDNFEITNFVYLFPNNNFVDFAAQKPDNIWK